MGIPPRTGTASPRQNHRRGATASAVCPGPPLRWCAEHFIWFYERLERPEGGGLALEGFTRLIIREIFAGGRVELLVLLPKGHGKTMLLAALVVFHILVTRNANAFVGAADRIQADEMYRFAAHFIETEPELTARLKVLRGTREIRSLVDQGFIRVLASDDSKQGGKRQGFNPTLFLVDELHAHENDNLYVDGRSGLFKRQGLLVCITTAGWDQESVLGNLRQSFLESPDISRGLNATADGKIRKQKDGRLTVARKPSGRSAMLEWAVNPEDDIEDLKTVKLANPATWVDMASLEDAKESLTPWTFARYRANRWTLGFESWLPEGSWDELADPDAFLRDELPIYGMLDMARYRDCAALVVVQPREGHRAFCRAWIRQGSEDDPVPYPLVMDRIRALHKDFELAACAFDPKYFDQAGQELLEEGIAMEEFPQSNERMCPAADGLRRAIVVEKALCHNGDAEFARHIMAPIAKEVGDNMFKLVKSRRNGPPIDAAVALAGAWALASAQMPVASVEFW